MRGVVNRYTLLSLLAVLVSMLVLGITITHGVTEAQTISSENQRVLCRIELRQYQVYNLGKPLPTSPPVDVCGLSTAAFQNLLRANPTPAPSTGKPSPSR